MGRCAAARAQRLGSRASRVRSRRRGRRASSRLRGEPGSSRRERPGRRSRRPPRRRSRRRPPRLLRRRRCSPRSSPRGSPPSPRPHRSLRHRRRRSFRRQRRARTQAPHTTGVAARDRSARCTRSTSTRRWLHRARPPPHVPCARVSYERNSAKRAPAMAEPRAETRAKRGEETGDARAPSGDLVVAFAVTAQASDACDATLPRDESLRQGARSSRAAQAAGGLAPSRRRGAGPWCDSTPTPWRSPSSSR